MPVIATTLSSGSANGRYAAQGDIESQFGIDNVTAWSQLDNSLQSADVSRIQTALDAADAKIISTFAGFGNYATPLAPIAEGVVIVRRWAAVIAGAWLYQSRGIRLADPTSNFISQLQSNVEAEMLTYRSAQKLNATRRWPTTNAPVGV